MRNSILEGDLPDDRPVESGSPGLIDFVLARAAAQNISVRGIADLCGLKRGRCHGILHKNRDKRLPFRIDEIEAILIAVKIDQIEASLATDIMARSPLLDHDAVYRVVLLMTELVRGLPSRVADIVEHIDGLDYDDIRQGQGLWLQVAVCDIIQGKFTEVAKRREFRLKDSEI